MPPTRRTSSRRRRRRAVRSAAAVAVLVAATAVVVVRLTRGPVTSVCTVAVPGAHPYTLSPDQAQNASIIAAVAEGRGLPDHAVTVALATALQESVLVNLDHGDRDSLGLFQQRPSEGWGTPAQIMDPAYAAAAFYSRLVKVPGWQALAVGEVAQAVQLSARPGAYAQWEGEARATARALTGEAPAGLGCRLGGYAGAVPAADALAAAARGEFGSAVLGPPLGAQRGWQVASWAVAHAWRYHLSRVSFAGMSWTAAGGTWAADPATGGSSVRVSDA